jgi:hypothetical protein
VVVNIKGEMVNLCQDPEKAAKNIATHAMLTMGKHVKFWEGPVIDGCISINHTFEGLSNTYEDELHMFESPPTHEMKMAGLNYVDPNAYKLSDHVILWLYRVREELAQGESSRDDVTRRTYFIGSVALNTIELLKCSIDSNAPKVFQVKHNFASTHVTCTIDPETDAASIEAVQKNIAFLDSLSNEYQTLETELHEFDVENKLRKEDVQRSGPAADQMETHVSGIDFVDDVDEARILSIVTDELYMERKKIVEKLRSHRFRPSPLRNLAEINELVQLEQVSPSHLGLNQAYNFVLVWPRLVFVFPVSCIIESTNGRFY